MTLLVLAATIWLTMVFLGAISFGLAMYRTEAPPDHARRGPLWQSAWQEVAEICAAHGIDPFGKPLP